MSRSRPARGPAITFAGVLLTGAVVTWMATSIVVAVPASPVGVAAVAGWPTLPSMALATVVVALVVTTGQWAALAPLALTIAPLVADDVAGVWVVAGAGHVLVWAMVLVAAVRSRAPTRRATWGPRWHAVAAAVAAALWLGGVAAAVSPFAMTGDAPHYLTIARSLTVDGDLDLGNDYDERTYRDFYPGSLEPRHTNLSPWGEQYPFHGIGVSVLVAAPFAAAGVAGATATLVVVMAGASALLWLAAWHLLGDRGAAWFGWAALVLTAPYALHAAAVYPDGPAAAAVAAALWLAALLHRGGPVPLWTLAAGSVGLAALPWLHVRLALPAGVIGLAIVATIWRAQPERLTRLAWFLMVPIVSLAAWVGSAQVMFGTWNPAMAMLQRTAPGGLADMGRGLLGLTADVQYGMVPAAPVMAAAPWAAVAFTRAFPLLGSATIVAAAGVMAMSSLWMWWGGDSAPARFLTVILPALALWLASLWSRASAGARRVLVLGLALTAGMTVLYATVDGGARAYTFADGRGAVFDVWSRSVDVGLALPSLFRAGESTGLALALALVWLVAGGGAAGIVLRLPASRGEGAATGLGGLVLLVAAGMAAEVGWRVAGRAPWTPASASLGVVQNVSARPMVGFGVDSLRVRSAGDVIDGLQLRTPESISERPPTLLYIPNVPAGAYAIHASVSGASDVAVRLELGREAWPFASWTLTQTSRRMRLHAAVHSVRILGVAPAGVSVWLQPRELERLPPAGEARRVTRYGDVIVYSMDDDTYAEPTGLWTGADRVTRLLVAPASESPAVDVALEAGPAPVELRLSATPGWSETVTLAPGARRIVPLAPDPVSGLVDLRVEVGGGFPAAALGNVSDSRTLGVWLAFGASDRR